MAAAPMLKEEQNGYEQDESCVRELSSIFSTNRAQKEMLEFLLFLSHENHDLVITDANQRPLGVVISPEMYELLTGIRELVSDEEGLKFILDSMQDDGNNTLLSLENLDRTKRRKVCR